MLHVQGSEKVVERRDHAHVRSLHTVQQTTPLTQALQLLLDAGVSALPVVTEVWATSVTGC